MNFNIQKILFHTYLECSHTAWNIHLNRNRHKINMSWEWSHTLMTFLPVNVQAHAAVASEPSHHGEKP